MNRLKQVTVSISPLQRALVNHPIYHSLKTISDVRLFMENHVFAVWDFMVTLKSLQKILTCTEKMWLPPKNGEACRLINEIVLCEECDEDGKGGYASHFELYHRAMQNCGADTSKIDQFTHLIKQGNGVFKALDSVDIPESTRSFVRRTISTALQGQDCELAAAFAFGRENILPGVFERVVEETAEVEDQSIHEFFYYLNRHIETDGEFHGPMAERMLSSVCEDNESKWQLAEESALLALKARITFWDGVLDQIENRKKSAEEMNRDEFNIMTSL
ncbi:DUF3050 domain-containing protein [Rhodopirellula sp.]|nr:DUF3050 domain-containing protein [Rhodopirellula sp.]MDB4678920.1 DUF3050 domain-containing protein [Rhodopirellula sp.]